jgi:cytochrome P450
MAFVCFYLMKHQEVQYQLQREIDEVFYTSGGGELPGYHSIHGLVYLDKVIHEVLRLHPPLAFLPRACIKDYK